MESVHIEFTMLNGLVFISASQDIDESEIVPLTDALAIILAQSVVYAFKMESGDQAIINCQQVQHALVVTEIEATE